MKITITTVYENVDQPWVDWWLKRCAPNYGFDASNVEPGEDFTHVKQDRVPTHPEVRATTTIKLYSEKKSAE